MTNRIFVLALIAALLLGARPALAAEHVVGQKNKAFSSETLKVKAGDTVKFANGDPFFHNIYSLSEGSTFDLGSFTTGQTRSFTFTRPGTVTVECAIHPEMSMEIEVTP
jgi:plastocyanin